MTDKPKYSLESMVLNGEDASDHSHRGTFLSFESTVSEGDTLDELCENSCTFTSDQDGGEGKQIQFDSLYIEEQTAVREDFAKQMAAQK